MLARHSLAWLSADGWAQAYSSAPESCREFIPQWQQMDWPAVARRRDADTGEEDECLGVALPPDAVTGIKRRIPVRASRSHIKKISAPLALKALLASAPDGWRGQLAALDIKACHLGIDFKVYGSAALQATTGQQYLTPTSDIDLLFYPVDETQLQDGLSLLDKYAATLPLDGEIVFPSGQAVAWKEWIQARAASTACRVLVKEVQAVYLRSIDELLATLESSSCRS